MGAGTMAAAAAGGARGARGTMASASEQQLQQLLSTGARTSPTRSQALVERQSQSHSRRAALARGDVRALGDALQVRRAELAAVERERERALLELRELQTHSHSAAGNVRPLLFTYSIAELYINCSRVRISAYSNLNAHQLL